MRTAVFFILVVVLGAAIGLGIEWLAQTFVTGWPLLFFTKVYSYVGAHPLSLNFTVSGVIGLLISYFIVSKFIKK